MSAFWRPTVNEEAVAAMFRESDQLGPILEEWALLDEMGLADDAKFLKQLRQIRIKISNYIAECRHDVEGLE